MSKMLFQVWSSFWATSSCSKCDYALCNVRYAGVMHQS